MRWDPDDYRLAANERIGQASALRRESRFALAMYVAGVAAECMLRAYHHEDRPFDERHDLQALLANCDLDRLGDAARKQLRGPLQTVHLLWRNEFRFAHVDMVRKHLHRLGLDRGVDRNADPVKVKCTELYNACDQVVSVGERRWTLD